MAMNGGNLIRKIKMECPLCDKVHEIEKGHALLRLLLKAKKLITRKPITFA